MSDHRRLRPRIWDTDRCGIRYLGATLAAGARCVRGYALVSGVCLLLNNAILILMDRAGAPLPGSIALSFATCVIVGYMLHARVSFRRPLEIAAFARYLVAMSANIPLAFATLWLWRDLAGLPIELAAPLASGSGVLVNFALCRFAVFAHAEVLP